MAAAHQWNFSRSMSVQLEPSLGGSTVSDQFMPLKTGGAAAALSCAAVSGGTDNKVGAGKFIFFCSVN